MSDASGHGCNSSVFWGGATAPCPPPTQWARASSFTRFLYHTQRRCTLGRWLLWTNDQLHLTTHTTQTDIRAFLWDSNPQSQQAGAPQTHALVRATTRTGSRSVKAVNFLFLTLKSVMFAMTLEVPEWKFPLLLPSNHYRYSILEHGKPVIKVTQICIPSVLVCRSLVITDPKLRFKGHRRLRKSNRHIFGKKWSRVWKFRLCSEPKFCRLNELIHVDIRGREV